MFDNVARLWTIVLTFNLVGAFIMGWVLGNTEVVSVEVRNAMAALGRATMNHDFWTLLLRGIFAGWLIPLMVWLMPFAEAARVWVIIIITYIVGIGEFSHIVAGSVDAFYLVGLGEKTILDYLRYMFPISLGNIIGGSSIVATIAHAQYIGGGEAKAA